MNLKSTITNPSERELELVACLENTMLRLAEAADHLEFVGACKEAVDRARKGVDVNCYLGQHGVKILDPIAELAVL